MDINRKPTDKQLEVIKVIQDQIHYWTTTNDLYSPTHGSDQTDDLNKLNRDFLLSEQETNQLDDSLWTILNIIRDIK